MLYQIKLGGQDRPIHFGLWALKTISETLKLDPSQILGGLLVTDLAQQITIARIGLVEGAKKKARYFNATLDPWASSLTDETLTDYLDENEQALEDAFNIYCMQGFGKNIAAIHAELEKQAAAAKDPKEKAAKTEALETSKNAWAKLTERTSRLASIELPKLA
jgi:hypothetical protein